MDWDDYKNKFKQEALRQRHNEDYISICLDYARHLYERQLPIIYDPNHLSLLVGYKYEYLNRASSAPKKFYRHFTIPKKNGNLREIDEPLPSLKNIQKWILNEILGKCEISKYAKAYKEGTSIKDNARYHRNQPVLLSVDIKDFFGSLRYNRVFHVFKKLGYSTPVSKMLTNLCCLDDKLPQGAVTSPYLSNLIMITFDNRMAGFCREYHFRYTRYADDITISGKFKPIFVLKFINNVLLSMGLNINDKKTRVRNRNQRQEVTGIIVNIKLQTPKELRKKIRQEIYYIEKYGLDSHLERTRNTRANYIKNLLGKAYYVKYINPKDKHIDDYIIKIREIEHP